MKHIFTFDGFVNQNCHVWSLENLLLDSASRFDEMINRDGDYELLFRSYLFYLILLPSFFFVLFL